MRILQGDQALSRIKNNKWELNVEFDTPPEEFTCPISRLLMKDPVIVEFGETYEKSSLIGAQKCPKTHRDLSHTIAVNNVLLKKLIRKWFRVTFFQEDTGGDVKGKNPTLYGLQETDFVCPLSKSLMKNAVVASCGETFEKMYIQEWMKNGKNECPVTGQKLCHNFLITNHSVDNIIRKWCNLNTFNHPTDIRSDDLDAENCLFRLLLEVEYNQLHAVKQMRDLTTCVPSSCSIFRKMGDAIPHLVDKASSFDEATYCDVVGIILNVFSNDQNKNFDLGITAVIPLLINALMVPNSETQSLAAAAFCELSSVNVNQEKIVRAGALRPLIQLMDRGIPFGSTKAASTLLILCQNEMNRTIALDEGVIAVSISKLCDPAMYDIVVQLLLLFSRYRMCREDDVLELHAVIKHMYPPTHLPGQVEQPSNINASQETPNQEDLSEEEADPSMSDLINLFSQLRLT